MKTLACFSAFFASILLTGCAGSYSPSASAVEGRAANDVIREGDKITIQLSGVPDGGFFMEKQIPASGDITLPILTQSFHVIGRNTAAVGSEITDAYKSQKIYTNPVVTVLAEERFIIVGGEVRSPSNVPYRPDSTLMSTITSCAGFTEYANRRSIRLIRGKEVIYYDGNKAASDPGADPPVYPGDQIYVSRTMF
jgi:protein involved in polysaccharide export with SLBB domain